MCHLQLCQTLILPLASHLPPHPHQEEQPGHVSGSLPWRWQGGNRWAETIRDDREDSPPSSLGFDNPSPPTDPASSPGHPLAPPDVLQSPESSWGHISRLFACPFYKPLKAISFWGIFPRAQQCGSLSYREGTALPHLQPALITILQPLFTYLLPPPKEDFPERGQWGVHLCS